MHRLRLVHLLVFGISTAVVSCGKKEDSKPKAVTTKSEPAPVENAVTAPLVAKTEAAPSQAVSETSSPKSLSTDLGEFGSTEPIERNDMPQRGILSFTTEKKEEIFVPAEHWEQYNFPFKARRSGRYSVRVNYTLKASTLGVQLKLGEDRLKKQLKHTDSVPGHTYLGEVTITDAGDQFMALYTPNGVAWNTFILHGIDLIPAGGEETKEADDGSVQLLARDAVTWSENMRYEAKEEKNCLGYWTEKDDFAEWEFNVNKPGKYKVTVHQGCGAGGGSEVAVQMGDQQLAFKVQDTGGFQNWAPVQVGEIQIDKPGVYRLAVKPQTKNGAAIMDVQKVILSPVS